ncbi:GrpB family protein [Ruminococcaceae bacterium OttesenSCG-928-O06]|nr:GrpB family protein [Ruminococcaceae bacterium OttesenSCG-928-O06]
MQVRVVPHNPGWAAAFRTEARYIREVLGDNLVSLFHIGSTAVPHLSAKPIIDILAVVADIEKVDTCNTAFTALGYEAMGEFGIARRRYFRKGGQARSHQLHIFPYDSVFDITRHLAFRDYLRRHPDVRTTYGALKEELATRYPNDWESYCAGKEMFIKRTERAALQWYWGTYARRTE